MKAAAASNEEVTSLNEVRQLPGGTTQVLLQQKPAFKAWEATSRDGLTTEWELPGASNASRQRKETNNTPDVAE
jgi:hypothetical protein